MGPGARRGEPTWGVAPSFDDGRRPPLTKERPPLRAATGEQEPRSGFVASRVLLGDVDHAGHALVVHRAEVGEVAGGVESVREGPAALRIAGAELTCPRGAGRAGTRLDVVGCVDPDPGDR